MSLVVCGKRSVFDDLHSPPPVSKRLRCGGEGLTWNPTAWSLENFHLSHLRGLFPDSDEQHLRVTLELCSNDLDSAIKSLNEYQSSSESCSNDLDSATRSLNEYQPRSGERYLSPCRGTPDSGVGLQAQITTEGGSSTANAAIDADQAEASVDAATPADGSEWIELFVREVRGASDFDAGKAWASKALEALEKTIVARMGALVEDLQKEGLMLKEQVHSLLRDNNILKRAVAIQHERQQEHEQRGHELQQLKQLLSQYQDHMRALEVNNYALTMHLQKAQESRAIPGCFHPDVF